MELNIDLVRDLFLHLDDNDSSIERINCDDDLLFYHLNLMADAGLVKPPP